MPWLMHFPGRFDTDNKEFSTTFFPVALSNTHAVESCGQFSVTPGEEPCTGTPKRLYF